MRRICLENVIKNADASLASRVHWIALNRTFWVTLFEWQWKSCNASLTVSYFNGMPWKMCCTVRSTTTIDVYIKARIFWKLESSSYFRYLLKQLKQLDSDCCEGETAKWAATQQQHLHTTGNWHTHSFSSNCFHFPRFYSEMTVNGLKTHRSRCGLYAW